MGGMIPTEVLAVCGVAIIGYIGETVLVSMNQKVLAVWMGNMLFIGTVLFSIKYFMKILRAVWLEVSSMSIM